MFKKVLIANRGAIACRVIHTLKKLGIASVAVYSEVDRDSLHVTLADEAFLIGPAPAHQSYLNIEKILEVAKQSGAEAIHPGYGFLSENAEFCDLCESQGIAFIGPTSSQMLDFGLKHTARELAIKSNVPLLPGSSLLANEAEALFEAARIGYPVMLKSTAGGGGIGMRLVWNETELKDAYQTVSYLAQVNFKDAGLYLEKFVQHARHIEVQIFGDGQGQVLALGERDCSVQRRHQKVLEEAPAPQMPSEKLEAMRQAAIDAARAVNYVGAGTVEFIVEQDGTAYFMEMNTRLQVEHPVTEMITGEDLVEWQLRVAYGEPLPKLQNELRIHGHALEARIYAEEPEKGFLPAIGKIDYLHYPTQNQYVRVDSGIVEGDEITTYYDPMIAKLIVWGKNREAALIQMQNALSQFHVDGLGNNIAFLEKIVRSESFKQAKLDTNLIQREQNFLFSPEEIKPELVVAAAFIEFLSQLNNNSSSQKQLWQAQPLWRLNIAYQHSIKLNYLNQNIQIKFASNEDGFTAEYNGQSYPISGQLINTHTASVQIGGTQQKLSFNQSQQGITLFQNGQSYKFAYIRQDFNQADSQADEGHLKAPMPGVVTQVLVSANHSVKKDDILMTLEAMKMEYTIRAPKDGVIVDSYFQVGDQVKAGDELVEFQPAQEEVA
ncbi:MAG TPA: 3-methylcrotonyl-CoA carboxylase [Acinetobacter nosocomialis]|nr:3-methylcrotonyl-CoA carboxylase [Acinetobacter nosocomialis]